ncbi:MAG: hypothetical protein ACOCXG_05155 [Nanoarchaeota archaeon]
MSNLIKQIYGTTSSKRNIDIRIRDKKRGDVEGKKEIEIKNRNRKEIPEYQTFLGTEIPHSQHTENLFKMKTAGKFKNDIPLYISEIVVLNKDLSKICEKILNKESECKNLTRGPSHNFVTKFLQRDFHRSNKLTEEQKQVRREKLLLNCVLLQKLIQQEFKKLTNN